MVIKSGLLSWPKSTLTDEEILDINLKRDTGNAQAADKSAAAKIPGPMHRANWKRRTDK